MVDIDILLKELISLSDVEYKKFQARMLCMSEKELIGVRVPVLRKIALRYKNISIPELELLLKNKFHDFRLLALLLLVKKFDSCKNNRKQIVDFYLCNRKYINNWDLVDLSAHKIIGKYFESNDKIFDKLSCSDNVWEARIAIVASWNYIKNNDFSLTLKLAERYLLHNSTVVHKATGWMLREIGKRDQDVLIKFLDKFYKKMPRIMLRYSVEKLLKQVKAKYFC